MCPNVLVYKELSRGAHKEAWLFIDIRVVTTELGKIIRGMQHTIGVGFW